MNDNSKSAWKQAWSKGNIGGSISSVLGGASGILEAGMANAQIKDTSAEESHIEGVGNTQFSTGNLDSLMNQFDATAMARNNFTRQEIRGLSDGQMAGNIFKGAASGALAGAQVGGIWGGIGGFFAGIGSGIAGIAVGNKRAREKANQLNKDAQLANASYINNFSNSVENTENTMFNNSLLNIAAHGGKIYIQPSKRGTFTAAAKQRGLGVQEFASRVLANKDNYSTAMVKKANFAKNASKWHHAYGGPLYNLTGDFTNGLIFIDAGGTHEQNPFGGVQVGVDYEGTPNLVEEGEIIYNDYVFSNRLKPTKKQLADGGFKDKYEGYTFAKLVEDISKPYMDTPNDPITKAGLKDMMNRIIAMQEEIRAKKKGNKDNKFTFGGRFANVFDGGSWLPYDNSKGFSYFNQNEYDKGYLNWLSSLSYDNNKDLIDDIASYYNTNIDPDATTGKDFVSTVQRLGQDKKFGEIHKKLGNAYTNSRLKDVNVDTDFSNVFNFEDITPEEIDITFDGSDLIQPTSKNKGFNWGSLGRYASIAADSADLITNLASEPDYSNAEAGVKAMREVPVAHTSPVGNYINLDPVDRNYLLNPLLSSSRSTSRAIQNYGLNAGQTQMALLAQQHELNKGIGQALMEADRENLSRKMQEAQFNLGIDQYNANQAMQTQQMNQQRAYNIAQAEAQAAQMREAIDAQKAAAINQNISGLTEGLAGIGQEAVYKDWLGALVDKDAIQDVFGTPKVKTKKCGGKLLTKKRK